MTKNPCFNCNERERECRIDCSAWLEYVKKRDAEYTRAERRAETEYVGHVIDRMERCRKRTRKRNRRRSV
jgi:hypothetical protein